MVLGDWPTQFYMRQIVYSRLRKAPSLQSGVHTFRSNLTPNASNCIQQVEKGTISPKWSSHF